MTKPDRICPIGSYKTTIKECRFDEEMSDANRKLGLRIYKITVICQGIVVQGLDEKNWAKDTPVMAVVDHQFLYGKATAYIKHLRELKLTQSELKDQEELSKLALTNDRMVKQ